MKMSQYTGWVGVFGVREFCGRAEVGLGRWAGRGQAVGKAREGRGPCDAAAACNGQSADHASAELSRRGTESSNSGRDGHGHGHGQGSKDGKDVFSSAAFALCSPAGGGGLGGALGVSPPVVIRQGRSWVHTHDTTRHAPTSHDTPRLVDPPVQRLVANQPPQRLRSQRRRVNSLTCCPLTAYASLGLS
jgi:hypothetical protein